MNCWLPIFVVLNTILSVAICDKCNIFCPPGEGKTECGFDPQRKKYTLFPSKCALGAYAVCHNVKFVTTPLKFCINNQKYRTRRVYGESCPAFCPNHYRPVCGASKMRVYMYRTFTNGCFFDMLNCRGDDLSGYVEVPLEFCQRHLMKNIFREQVVISNFHDYRDYHEY